MSVQSERLFDAITGVGEDLIETAQKPPAKKRRRWYRWAGPVAAVLAGAILIGVLSGRGGITEAYAIAEAEYPKEAAGIIDMSYIGTLEGFLQSSIPEFLGGAGGENRVYSPLNVYMALSMLAEVTDGNTRRQIMDLLGAEDIAVQRQRARNLWNVNYYTGERGACVLADSIWLNQDVDFVQSTLETLAKDYYASSFRGEMGSAGFDSELRRWLNEQTGGLLEQQANGVSMPEKTVLALASTVYFKGSWSSKFNPEGTSAEVFHAPGGDLTCDFMHGTKSGTYFWGERFSAAAQHFTNNRMMLYILPDEGETPETLLADPELLSFLSGGMAKWEDYQSMQFNFTIPKFDVVSDIDLLPGLAALGITDVQNPAAADFSPMVKQSASSPGMPVWVEKAKHAARVMVDEEGCVAAAYTVIGVSGGSMPPDETVDFTLDRPFLFVITGRDGMPLFVGIVNNPVS